MSAESGKEWTSIASLAALGTSRASQPFDELWPDASVAMPGNSPESTMLRVAAARYLWSLAGLRAAISPPLSVERAPPLEKELISETASWRMSRMLNGEHRDLLHEWFTLAARAGRVLAPQWLPVVLDVLKPSELAEAASALGQRAVWLAARNTAWQLRDTTAAPSEERWSNGTLAERLADLAILRATDPATARTWIEQTWEVDPPEAREGFVRALLKSLSADDEALLETALRDKRKAVRSAAIEGLARLRGSAYSLRNLERVEPLLAFDPPNTGLLGKLRKRKLRVELPAALDKSAVKDGIESNPPANRKIGERTWWLAQMVALAPPSHWTARFDCDPKTLIDAVCETDYGAELLGAFMEAANRHSDESWLSALLQRFLSDQPPRNLADSLDSTVQRVVSAAPDTIRETLLAQALAAIHDARFPLALDLLNVSGTSWSPEITRRAFELLGHRVRAEPQQYALPRNTLAEWGVRAQVEIAVAEIARIDALCPDPSPWRNAVESLKETLEFRAAMRQELQT